MCYFKMLLYQLISDLLNGVVAGCTLAFFSKCLQIMVFF